jgi:hypothetical protein
MGITTRCYREKKDNRYYSVKVEDAEIATIRMQIADLEHDNNGRSLFPTLTFEEGVLAAIVWITGETTVNPLASQNESGSMLMDGSTLHSDYQKNYKTSNPNEKKDKQ